MIDFTNLDMRPRFADPVSRQITKGQAAMDAFAAVRSARPRPAALATAPSPAMTHRSAAGKPTGGAGVDYPASWVKSPVDAGAEHGEHPERQGSTFGHRQPTGAGVDYPAHWKR